jgi:hypothetical protein
MVSDGNLKGNNREAMVLPISTDKLRTWQAFP